MSASPGGIVPDYANGKDTRAEGSKIVGSVGAAAGSEMRFTVTENQDGRLARDSGNLAKLVFIGNKIAKENHRLRGKLAPRNPQGPEDRQTRTERFFLPRASFRWPQNPVNGIGKVGGYKIRLNWPLCSVPKKFTFAVARPYQNTAGSGAIGKRDVTVTIPHDEGAVQIDGMLVRRTFQHSEFGLRHPQASTVACGQ